VGLVEALGLERGPGLVSIVGGGGKSSLLFALARELSGRVVMTTTTRIFAAQMKLSDEVCSLGEAGWEARLDAFDSSLLLVGGVEGDRATGIPADLPGRLLARPSVDWVVVEADGSRMRPVKAPADHEPVIPEETSLLVPVVGMDALAGPIREVAHRPERVCEITGLGPEETLSEEALAVLLRSERGGLKNAPGGARVAVLVNKVESDAQRESAGRIARCVLREPRVDRVVSGALLGAPDRSWEVWSA
jgi:molybdenum cofactor cytidylyltransferase